MSCSTSGCANHCPFLNRCENQCGEHLSLHGIDYAFEYCFGKYQNCPSYAQLLNERQQRRGRAIQNLDARAEYPLEITVRATAA